MSSIKELCLEWQKTPPEKDQEYHFMVVSNENLIMEFSGKIIFYDHKIYECYKYYTKSFERETINSLLFEIQNEEYDYIFFKILLNEDCKQIYSNKLMNKSGIEFFSDLEYATKNKETYKRIHFKDDTYDLFITPLVGQESAMRAMKNGASIANDYCSHFLCSFNR